MAWNATTYAVALSNAALPAAAWYFLFQLFVVCAFAVRGERTNDEQKEEKYRREQHLLEQT